MRQLVLTPLNLRLLLNPKTKTSTLALDPIPTGITTLHLNPPNPGTHHLVTNKNNRKKKTRSRPGLKM